MKFSFEGTLWFWRGPAPWHFVTVPPEECEAIAEVARAVSYGWGMVPVVVRAGRTEWSTSLWPKSDGYIVPIKTAVRLAEHLELDDVVMLQLEIG
jgi:hypothetical protein